MRHVQHIALASIVLVAAVAGPARAEVKLSLFDGTVSPTDKLTSSTPIMFSVRVPEVTKISVMEKVTVEARFEGSKLVIPLERSGTTNRFFGVGKIPGEGPFKVVFRVTGRNEAFLKGPTLFVSNSTLKKAPTEAERLSELEAKAIADGVPASSAKAAAKLDLDFQNNLAKGQSQWEAFARAATNNPGAAGTAIMWAFAKSDLKPFFAPFKASGILLQAASHPGIRAIGKGLIALAEGGEAAVTLVKVMITRGTDPKEAAIDALADLGLDQVLQDSERGGAKEVIKLAIKEFLSTQKSKVLEDAFASLNDKPPVFSNASLPSSTPHDRKAFFSGALTDDKSLATLRMIVSGPRGSNLVAFDDNLQGTSKGLASYFFDPSSTSYAGKSGRYTVVLQARDKVSHQVDRSFTIEVTAPAPPPNQPPSVSMSLPSSVGVKSRASFSGSATDDRGLSRITMSVNGPKGSKQVFSDAVSGTSKSLSAYYFDGSGAYAGKPGTYTVTLRVEDRDGATTTRTATITVK